MARLPVKGEYFVFSLDFEQSCSQYLDDARVAIQVQELAPRTKTYIGCCTSDNAHLLYPMHSGVLYPTEIDLVSVGGLFSYSTDSLKILPEMTLPIAPATNSLHRITLKTLPVLPWENCYQCTAVHQTVRVAHGEDARPVRGKYSLMPRQQVEIVYGYREDDQAWAASLKQGNNNREPEDEGLRPMYERWQAESDEAPSFTPLDAGGHTRNSGAHQTASMNGNESNAQHSQAHVAFSAYLQDLLSHCSETPVIKVNYDLETVPIGEICGNPYDFLEEVKNLQRIFDDRRARVNKARVDAGRLDDLFDRKPSPAPDTGPPKLSLWGRMRELAHYASRFIFMGRTSSITSNRPANPGLHTSQGERG